MDSQRPPVVLSASKDQVNIACKVHIKHIYNDFQEIFVEDVEHEEDTGQDSMVSVQRVFIVVHVTGIDDDDIEGDDDDDLAGAQDAAMLT